MANYNIGASTWGESLSADTPASSITITGDRVTFRVERGDPATAETFRSEFLGKDLGLTQDMATDVEYLVRFTLNVPPTFVPDSTDEIIWQLHHVPDPEEEGMANQPPLAVRLKGRRLRFTHWYSTAPISYAGAGNNQVKASSGYFGYIQGGEDYAIDLRFMLTKGDLGVGYFYFYFDNLLRYAYQGPLGYEDIVGHYMKFGIYKANWRPGKPVTDTTVRELGYTGMSVIRADYPFGEVATIP